ncbi:MAG: GyrI-like domain-containing protein [Flammeovirgaceae bacterium]|nr:GyrI-like domain-containing protein [Flammeovirgaceae bacterium]
MKHEWRKKEKKIYIPANKPEVIEVPKFKFLTINGEGNPNMESFTNYIEVLYTLSYGIKMSPKKGMELKGFYDYTVYPLEGVWDINEKAKKNFNGLINKDDLVFKLMIRQPDFVHADFVGIIREMTIKRKPLELLREVSFEEIEEGKCIQMLHKGSFDNEPETFKVMEEFAETNGLKRVSKIHREIYLSDTRKVAPEKLKTTLRFNVEG